jgi:hypothetical protein
MLINRLAMLRLAKTNDSLWVGVNCWSKEQDIDGMDLIKPVIRYCASVFSLTMQVVYGLYSDVDHFAIWGHL